MDGVYAQAFREHRQGDVNAGHSETIRQGTSVEEARTAKRRICPTPNL